MESIYYFVLVPMVYVSVLIFILGIAYRLFGVLKKPSVKIAAIYPAQKPAWLLTLSDVLFLPTVRRHNPVLWVFLMAFHICFFLLFLGHLELIREFAILQVWPHEIFMGAGFIGLILAICILYFIMRRFVSPTKDLTVPEDYYMLILLFLTVIFGSEMDWARNWYGYSSMGVEEYRDYLMSMVTFQPDIYSVTDPGHSFMLVLHVFFANLFLIFFPFSHFMHSIFTFALNRIRRG